MKQIFFPLVSFRIFFERHLPLTEEAGSDGENGGRAVEVGHVEAGLGGIGDVVHVGVPRPVLAHAPPGGRLLTPRGGRGEGAARRGAASRGAGRGAGREQAGYCARSTRTWASSAGRDVARAASRPPA